ncbi:MAG: tetratricopeptide repeat protein [Planctomycetes bacterium]|nr:tetratricopeptide repeat protein [Planctomycetota bacterium]
MSFRRTPAIAPALFAALLLSAAGCSSGPDKTSEDPGWRDAESAYLAGDWPTAISAYERFISAHPDDKRATDARLRIGRAYLAQNRPASALPFLDQVVSSNPPDPVKADAHAARGMAQHLLGNPQRAEAEFMDAVRIGGSEIRRDECLYYVAVSKIRQGRWDEGLGDLGLVVRETPDSPYAIKARALRSSPERFFTVQAGAFADPAGARRRADELRTKGFDATIVPEGTLNCVRVGKYSGWREAIDQAKLIETTVGGETAVVP